MPKMKSHRGARKTFSVTATGKIKRRKMNRSHILTSKTTKRKRRLRKAGYVSKADSKKIKEMLVA
ncbi:MAG TPA: 50S ribosomal protein L35 [Bacteroidetes bacterium]|jgi:large subunit ribosomal protein L35|nr:50S ribosomal protein L35 [Bacteroidota bacterium]